MHFSYDKQDFPNPHALRSFLSVLFFFFLFSLSIVPVAGSAARRSEKQTNKLAAYCTFKQTMYHFQYYMLLNTTHADSIIKTFAAVPWPHAFAQLFVIDLSTERPVFPPLCSHLRHFSCHSWRQTVERARTRAASLSDQMIQKLRRWAVYAQFSLFHLHFFLLYTASHICFYSFQSSNSTFFQTVFSLQGFSCKTWH